MSMTLKISDDLSTEDVGEIVEIAKEEGKPVGRVLLEAARARARERRAEREKRAIANAPEVQAQHA